MRPLERFFYQYGALVARHPWPFIIIPSIITLISTYGYTYFHSQDDIWDIYAPIDGLSRVEEEGLRPFEFASGFHHHRIQILVNRKDEGNLLKLPILEEIANAHKFVADNVTAWNGLQHYSYGEMCGVYCNESNAAVLTLLQAIVNSDFHSNRFKLTYPNAETPQKRVYLGYSIGGLTFDSETNKEVIDAKLIILHYMIDTSLPNGKQLAFDFDIRLREVFEKFTGASTNLKFSLLSRIRELEEQRKITLTSIPFLAITILVLTSFMLITMTNFPLYKSQHLESFIGVFSPGMALYTSAGFLFWLGYPFSNILTVVPFLVVTIGIDDAFLVLAGWRHSTKGASLEQRLAESVSISGASVTVTSVTDVLCFGIGLFSNMPVVQLFCLYTTVALFVDFIYQMTFFTAFVGIIGERQIRLDELRKEEGEKEDSSSLEKLKTKLKESSSIFSIGIPRSRTPDSSVDLKNPPKSGVEQFVDWLHTRTAQIFILGIFIAHMTVCSYYATKVNTDFDMENLYLADSPLTDISRIMQNFMLKESFTVNFAVQPIPNFSNDTIRERFDEMVHRLQNLKDFGAGSEASVLWTREYTNAMEFWGDEQDIWESEKLLSNFRENGLDEKFLLVSNSSGTEEIAGFFFSVAYHNMSSFLEVEEMMSRRRLIINDYPEFHVLSHHPFEKVPTESAASAPSNFIQTVVSAIILMSLLVFLFVMNVEAIISVVLSIISICLGIIAYLHLWNVHLDAVSLISILMSVGFSVDYSAHVCYHYFAHAAEEEKEQGSLESGETVSNTKPVRSTVTRLISTLNGVGWPVIQSGFSTIIGIAPLVFVPAYVVAVFWKTIVLVGILGIFHALLLLPVIFILTDDLKMLCCCRKNRKAR